jgi:hypothetical protein
MRMDDSTQGRGVHENYAEKKVRKEIDTCNNHHHLQPHLPQNENGQLKISN